VAYFTFQKKLEHQHRKKSKVNLINLVIEIQHLVCFIVTLFRHYKCLV